MSIVADLERMDEAARTYPQQVSLCKQMKVKLKVNRNYYDNYVEVDKVLIAAYIYMYIYRKCYYEYYRYGRG